MKKLSLNAKFITTSLFCLALLAVPALAVQGQALYYAAPQPRPQVPGVMSDEVRLDPLAGALYRYGVQGGSSTPQSYDITKDVFTVIRGKLRQAAARGLLTDDQLTYLLAQLDAGADTNPFQQSLTEGEPNVTYGMVKFTGDLTQVYFDYFIPRDVHETESGSTACVMDTETYLVIDYLPDNGPIVDLSIHDENYPAGEDLDTVTQNFIAQLDTTIPGHWQQTTTPEDDPTYQRYIYAHDSGVLRVTSHHIHQQDFSLTVMLEPEVYGSLYTLNSLAHDPYGQTYTAPQK